MMPIVARLIVAYFIMIIDGLQYQVLNSTSEYPPYALGHFDMIAVGNAKESQSKQFLYRADGAELQPDMVYMFLSHHKAGSVLCRKIAQTMAGHFATQYGYLIRGDNMCEIGSETHGTTDVRTVDDVKQGCNRFRAVHVIRDPWDLTISGYNYHRIVNDPIPYLDGSGPDGNGHPEPGDYEQMSLHDGLAYEASAELRSTVVDMIEVYQHTQPDSRFATVRLEDFENNFNGTLYRIFSHMLPNNTDSIQTLIDDLQAENVANWSPEKVARKDHVDSPEEQAKANRKMCKMRKHGNEIITKLAQYRKYLGYNQPLQCP